MLRTAALTLAALTALGTVPAQAGGCSSSSSASKWSSKRTASASHGAARADIVETALAAGNLSTLTTALARAGLVDDLANSGPFTVFAPTDAAFAKLPAGTVETLLKPENRDMLVAVLTYHVVPGRLDAAAVTSSRGAESLNGQRIKFRTENGGVFADGSRVVAADIAASNGIVHLVDSVLLPADADIVQTARGSGQFRTLLAALDAAHLTSVLQGEGPYTVFAPTDEAFAKLPAGTVESLLEPRNRHQLADILKYHVVPGRVFANQAARTDAARTVEGTRVSFDIVDGRLAVNDAAVLASDVEASNGVIHVIDGVLLPNT